MAVFKAKDPCYIGFRAEAPVKMEKRTLESERLGLWVFDVTIILAVCLLLFFRGIGTTPFYDKQEAREALVI